MPAKSKEPDLCKSKTELIRRLGIGRTAFYEYEKQGAPKRLSVKSWQNWIAKKSLGVEPKGRTSAKATVKAPDLSPEARELADLKLRAARAEAETKEANAQLARWKADAAVGSQLNGDQALKWLTHSLEPLAKWLEALAGEYGQDYPETPEEFFILLEEIGFEGAELARQSLQDAAERLNS